MDVAQGIASPSLVAAHNSYKTREYELELGNKDP